jgi:hypothetical protein
LSSPTRTSATEIPTWLAPKIRIFIVFGFA